VTTTNVFAAAGTLTGATGRTTLNVTGNIYASNAITTTNVFAATETLTGSTGQTTLNVTGNIYASNAITTTNVFASRYYGDGGLLSNITSSGPAGSTGAMLYLSSSGVVAATTVPDLVWDNTNKRLGIGTNPTTYTFQVNGTVGVSGDITALYSDERLKTKTGALSNALDKVCMLDTFTYVSNELAQKYGFTDSTQRVGLSAQQVQKVLPEVVKPAPFDADNLSGQNFLTVQYDKLVPLLIESIKELKVRLERLEKQT
jgi:hypothetical protein